MTARISAAGVLACCVAASAQPTQAPQTTFRAAVDVTSIDVTVVDDRGKPIVDLKPADFTVRIDGSQRKVLTAEWVPLVTAADDSKPAPPPPPAGYTSNESSMGGRLIVIAVDEPNIRFGGAMAIARTANMFIDRLSPADRVAVAGFGVGAPATVFTADRDRIKRTIARMVGQRRPSRTVDLGHNIALVEAQAIQKGDRTTLEAVQTRECQGLERSPAALDACRVQVELEAQSMAQDARNDAEQTLQSLRDLFYGLRRIDAPKTLILISEGFVLTDEATIIDLGTMAAQARTSVYALKLDTPLFDITEVRAPINPFQDRQARTEGLEMLAGAARGTLFTVAGTGETLFQRIESELSGYYLLGVESDPRDKDRRSRTVRVDVPRRGAIVRTRRQVLNAEADRPAPKTARAAVAAALGSPLLSSALPLRVASFALQGPERGRIQLLIHADVGTDYASARAMAVGYVISDKDGKEVDRKSEVTRLSPPLNGVPAPLEYTAGASLPPGDYTLKLAVAEGDRVGTIEHPIHAGLADAGDVRLSELMAGGPIDPGDQLRPTIGYQVTYGSLHGYVEAYGSSAAAATMEYEIATDADAPALLNVDVPPRAAGSDRVIFTRVMPVQALPPGKYVLRAILSAGGRSLKTLTRPFEIAPPKVLMASADGLGGATSVDAELYLPVDDAVLSPSFQKETAIARDTVDPFVERIEPAAKTSFDQGLAFLAAGDYARAETSFKQGIAPENDSTSSLAYLAVAFAASGHDAEAASAWQTALVEGDDMSQIYAWLSGALLRTRAFAEARAILEEAVGKWPADARFTKPLAMLYGTFGRGREAVRTLERYLADHTSDAGALYYAVEWLYTVHSAGASVHGKAEDAKLARGFSDAYVKAGGPNTALVKQWVDYLEKER